MKAEEINQVLGKINEIMGDGAEMTIEKLSGAIYTEAVYDLASGVILLIFASFSLAWAVPRLSIFGKLVEFSTWNKCEKCFENSEIWQSVKENSDKIENMTVAYLVVLIFQIAMSLVFAVIGMSKMGSIPEMMAPESYAIRELIHMIGR